MLLNNNALCKKLASLNTQKTGIIVTRSGKFRDKKANFSGSIKFLKMCRKIETYALTLKFSHSEKAFCHSVHMCISALVSGV